MKIRTQLFAILIASAVPGLASGQILWNTANGNLGTSTNWNPNTPITTTGQTWNIANGGTATVDNGNDYTLTLISSTGFYVGNTGGSGTLILNGNGKLTVTGGNMSIGQGSGGGAGSVILNGTSHLTTGSLFIGHRATGTLTVNSGTQVSSSTFNISTGSTGGNGTVNLYGTLNVSGTTDTSIRLGSSPQNTQGTLNIYAGSSLTSAGGLTTSNVNGPYAINMNGSGSTFSLAKNLIANNASTTFSFLADEDGITTISSGMGISIGGAALKLNLDAYTGSDNLVLFSGSSITGTFASIDWLGSTQGTLMYGADSIYIVVPEPSTAMFFGIGLFAIAMTRSTRRRAQRNPVHGDTAI